MAVPIPVQLTMSPKIPYIHLHSMKSQCHFGRKQILPSLSKFHHVPSLFLLSRHLSSLGFKQPVSSTVVPRGCPPGWLPGASRGLGERPSCGCAGGSTARRCCAPWRCASLWAARRTCRSCRRRRRAPRTQPDSTLIRELNRMKG